MPYIHDTCNLEQQLTTYFLVIAAVPMANLRPISLLQLTAHSSHTLFDMSYYPQPLTVVLVSPAFATSPNSAGRAPLWLLTPLITQKSNIEKTCTAPPTPRKIRSPDCLLIVIASHNDTCIVDRQFSVFGCVRCAPPLFGLVLVSRPLLSPVASWHCVTSCVGQLNPPAQAY